MKTDRRGFLTQLFKGAIAAPSLPQIVTCGLGFKSVKWPQFEISDYKMAYEITVGAVTYEVKGKILEDGNSIYVCQPHISVKTIQFDTTISDFDGLTVDSVQRRLDKLSSWPTEARWPA